MSLSFIPAIARHGTSGLSFRIDPAGRLSLAGQANGTDDYVNEYVNVYGQHGVGPAPFIAEFHLDDALFQEVAVRLIQ